MATVDEDERRKLEMERRKFEQERQAFETEKRQAQQQQGQRPGMPTQPGSPQNQLPMNPNQMQQQAVASGQMPQLGQQPQVAQQLPLGQPNQAPGGRGLIGLWASNDYYRNRRMSRDALEDQIDQMSYDQRFEEGPLQPGVDYEPSLTQQQAGLLEAILPTHQNAVAAQLFSKAFPQAQTRKTGEMERLMEQYIPSEERPGLVRNRYSPRGTNVNVQNVMPSYKSKYADRPPLKPGQVWNDFIEDNPELKAVKIPGTETYAKDTAGALAMTDVAISGLGNIQDIMFSGGDPLTGEMNSDAIMGAWQISKAGPLAAVPGLAANDPMAGELARSFETGIQAITRTETGAAMPPGEVENTRTRFQPKPWESDVVQRQKFIAYKLFLNNVQRYMDPNREQNGNWSANVQLAIEDAKKLLRKKPKTPPLPGPGRVIEQ